MTKYYKQAKRPFGVIVTGDMFKAGLIRYGRALLGGEGYTTHIWSA